MSLSAMMDAPARIKSFVRLPDSALTGEPYYRIVRRIDTIFKDEGCFMGLTNETGWSYLLKKPSCGRFYLAIAACTKPWREEMLRDLETREPQFILVRTPFGFLNALDGIPTSKRLPEVYDYVGKNYEFFEDIAGYVVWRRKKGDVSPVGGSAR